MREKHRPNIRREDRPDRWVDLKSTSEWREFDWACVGYSDGVLGFDRVVSKAIQLQRRIKRGY